MRMTLAALLLLAAPGLAQSPFVDASMANRIRADVEFLASDNLEGRDTGSRGYNIAADYVASQFRAIGLEPAGEKGGWFQQVPFRRASYDAQPKLTLTVGGKTIALEHGRDAGLRPSVLAKSRKLNAGFVFVGYGVQDRRYGLDDYRGLNVRGKIVVAMAGSRGGLPSDVDAHLNSSKERIAAEHGAIGYVELPRNSGSAGRFDPVRRAGRPLIDWVDGNGLAGATPPGMLLQLSFSQDMAAQLFAGAPKSLAAIRSEAKSKGRLRGFNLTPVLSVDSETKWEDFTSPEVIGILKGSDPSLASQNVVLMGHLDHLGVVPDAKPGEDAIYNGALDNAAGVATMLEAARQFAAQPVRPKRSVLFIANTGEERGLLGADYYANHPTVPAASIVGLVDLDMPVLLYPFTDVTAFGADHSTIGATVADAGRSMGISVAPDPMPQEAIFTRSDHYKFVRRGVPAVLLMTGYANGGAAVWSNYLGKVYHSPQDDLSQKIDWESGARYALLNYRIAREMADAPQRPMWLQGDYFGDLFDPDGPRAPAPAPPRP